MAECCFLASARGYPSLASQRAVTEAARTCGAAMSPRPLLPFTPSTTFSHRDIEQRVGPRSPRTPRLDAAFSAVPMRGVVLPGRFSVGPRDFSRFEQMSAWNTAAQKPAPHPARSPAPAQARGGLPALASPGQPSGPYRASRSVTRALHLVGTIEPCSPPRTYMSYHSGAQVHK